MSVDFQRKICACVFLICGTLCSRPASACECMLETLEESISNSALIFSGTLNKNIYPEVEGGKNRLEFKVLQMWKGSNQEKIITLEGSPYGLIGGCDYYFEEGKSYLIFTYSDRPRYTNSCTRTSELSKAEPSLAELRKRFGRRKEDG